MPKTKAQARIGLVIVILVSLLVVPLATGVLAPRSTAYAQIDFTPNVATLVVTPTPQGPTIGPLVRHAGDRFQCVGLGGVMGGTECRPELVMLHGDDLFGWGEMVGYPGLVLVWVTDEAGTHFMVVPADDPQLVGVDGGDSFQELMDLRLAQVEAMRGRIPEMVGSGAGPVVIIGGLLLLCPETAGVTCVIAGLTAGAAGLGNIIRNAILNSQSQDRIKELDQGLIGRFHQMELTTYNP
jgi:hypothetical protein